MSEKTAWMDKVKKIFGQHEGQSKFNPKTILILLAAGIGVMLISSLTGQGSSPASKVQQAAASPGTTNSAEQEVFKQSGDSEKDLIAGYEQEYENQLKEVLETISGIDDVSVVVNVDATSLKVLEKNRNTQSQTTNETDRDGGERKVEDVQSDEQIVIIKQGDKETPIVLQYTKPAIRGVLVVAKGADNVQIKKMIVDSVTRVLGVESFKVAVAPKKIKEAS
ncbi:stage III sporulation protein AG [Bacillus sp. FJAT-42376]|uniref:stage III sporulation protein AG n=1 Tax=Bacillus sp. FJAT-42376 TaxID=2014076 RepID=UPI000F4EFF4D|nr:stage III sporulation protein AG [Bacillus sp. FJAT-42376]AZB43534.1 stage III sporulation protein AG [Bacillus sp. FJAT-42376]